MIHPPLYFRLVSGFRVKMLKHRALRNGNSDSGQSAAGRPFKEDLVFSSGAPLCSCTPVSGGMGGLGA